MTVVSGVIRLRVLFHVDDPSKALEALSDTAANIYEDLNRNVVYVHGSIPAEDYYAIDSATPLSVTGTVQ